jgi:nitrite reductase (NADH) small subunit
MSFVRVYSMAKLPPGDVTEVMLDGQIIALCNVGGEVRALDGICPHEGGPLGGGAMNGENVVCPWHMWEFNSRSGCLDWDESTCLTTFPVRVEGDDILVDPGA